jgi:hypothetical protein
MKKNVCLIPIRLICLSLILLVSICESKAFAQTTTKDAISCFDKIDATGNMCESISPEKLNLLPIGVSKTMGNTPITLAVSSVVFHENYAELNIYARVISLTGGVKKKLFFGGQNIKLSYKGDIFGDATLVLLGDVDIPINKGGAKITLKGSFDNMTGRGDNLTYATIDCKGIKEIGITADLEFSTSLLTGVDDSGKSNNQAVKSTFKTVVSDWNDIVAQLSLPLFQIKGLDGFVFGCKNIVLDFSDKKNLNTTFPASYAQNYLPAGNQELWKGVFIQDLTVYLPPQFKSTTTSGNDVSLANRTKFEARQMIVDDNGITGQFNSTTPLLSFDKGDASGWNFSVDGFHLELEANTLKSAGFNGSIGLPVCDTTKLAYDALIDADNNYVLTVKPVSNIDFNFLNAKTTIYNNSSVTLSVVNNRFVPEATLHGKLLMAPFGNEAQTNKADSTNMCIEFQSMHLTTKAPYFEVASMQYSGKPLLQNFPISIPKIGITSQNSQVNLNMDVLLNLSTSEVGIGGSASLTISSEIITENDRQKWRYKNWKLSEVAVNATVADIFNLNGHLLLMRDDPTYGNGFAGKIEMKFQKVLPGVNIKAGAIFGQRNDSKYWFCDAAVSGFSIPVGAMNISGFAGGVSMGMKKIAGTDNFSATGCKYVPEPAMGLGVKAAVFFNLKKPEVFMGEAAFEILFNRRSGGVAFAGMYGAGKFMGEVNVANDLTASVIKQYNSSVSAENEITKGDIAAEEKLQEEKKQGAQETASKIYKPSFSVNNGGLAAVLSIQFDFANSSFHSVLDTYVYLAGGILRGKNADNSAGSAVIHFDKSTWYAKIGTPKQPIGLKMGIGNILNVEASSYFMIGNDIPNPEPPPAEVLDILGSSASSGSFISNSTDLSNGQGFAFGSRFSLSTGEITFWPLYAHLSAGLGYDIMLKKYSGAICAETGQLPGINGWYASGQAYGYFDGELGINVKLPFFRAKLPIIQAGSAILMQASLPNPIWFNGKLGVKFRLLGGLVKGNMKFEVTLGKKCTLVQQTELPPVDMQIISELSPQEDADVFAAPQVAFNSPIGESFQIKVDNTTSTYRFRLGEFSIADAAGKTIVGDLQWNADKDKVSLFTSEVLPSNQTLSSVVSVYLEEYKNNNWVTVIQNGKRLEEKKEFSFKTGDAPQYIPITNVDYTYPVVDQSHFMPKETSKGFIVLKKGQSYLFNAGMIYQANFIDENNTKKNTEITYDMSQRRIEYSLPTLDKSKTYSFSLTAQPRVTNAISANSTATTTGVESKEGVEVRQNTADKIIRNDMVKVFLEYAFKASKYDTFKDRISGINKKSPLFEDISSDVIGLKYSVSNMEPFDYVELTGTNYTTGLPLITTQSTGDDLYYRTDIYPYLYEKYNPQIICISNRDTKLYGIPPFKAVIATSYYLNALKSNNEKVLSGSFPFAYYLPSYYKSDFINIQDQIVTKFIQTGSWNGYDLLMNYRFMFIRKGNYPILLKYILPDGTKSSEVIFEFKNL